MSLEKRTVSIRVGGGLAEDQDAFLLESPAALMLKNVRLSKTGAIGKRNGYAELSTSGSFAGTTGTATLLELNGGLFQTHPEGSLALDEHADRWSTMNVSSPRPARVLADPLIRGNQSLACPDIAIIGDLMLVVWEDQTQGSIGYAFFHAATRTMLGAPGLVSGTYYQPRVLARDTYFVVVAEDSSSNDLDAWAYNSASTSYTLGSATALSNVGDWEWDVAPCATATNFVICRRTGIGNDSQLLQYASPGFSAGAIEAITGFKAVSLTYNAGNDKIVAASAEGYLAYCDADMSPSTATVTGQLFVPQTPYVDVREVHVVQRDALGGMWYVVGGRNQTSMSTSESSPHLEVRRITSGFAASGSSRSFGVQLAGRGCYLGDTEQDCLLPVWSGDAPSQWADFVKVSFDEEGDPVLISCGTALRDKVDKDLDYKADTHGAASYTTHLPRSVLYGDVVYMPQTVLIDMRGEYDIVDVFAGATRRQIDLVRADVLTPPVQRSATTQRIRVIADGGGATCIDATRHAELTPPSIQFVGYNVSDTDGTLLMPVASIPSADPDGVDGAVEFLLRCHWRWVDSQGNVHRGPPSEQISFSPNGLSTGASGGNVGARRIKVPKPLTALDGLRGVKLELEVSASWSTGTAEDWHFAGVVQPIEHPSNPSCVFFRITWADMGTEEYDLPLWTNASLIENTAPYWLDELEALPPGPLLDVCSTQDRLWALSAEDRLTVLVTKPIVPGIAPEFAPELSIRIPAEGGECVAIAALGDGVVVLKQRNVYTLFGEPGAADGSGGSIQAPRLVPCDVGCLNAHSVVDCGSLGIAFQSERGIVMLTPSLAVENIGEPVKDTLSGNVSIAAGTLVPSETEVRWALTNGDVIVWNYRVNAWSASEISVSSACVRDGVYAFLSSENTPYVETPGAWDEGSDAAMVVATPWIQAAGKQGIQRVGRIVQLLRHYTGGLHVGVAYDFDEQEEPDEEHVWEPDELGALAPCQPSLDPMQPKCEAIRLVLTEVGVTDGEDPKPPPSSGRGFELIGLDFVLGVKRGTYRHHLPDGGKR